MFSSTFARLPRLSRALGLALLLVGSAGAAAVGDPAPSSVAPLRPASPASSAELGLLFHLSADNGPKADFAASGETDPNFLRDVTRIGDGAGGAALRCAGTQRLSYWAPANIYAQRGTLSFFWRAREAVGPTEFPVFRVSYGDHSSWDMVWLRIDYNGHGFDAFVTDINLARTRVSVSLQPFPAPDEWIHLALAWDENSGIRFYINGKLAGVSSAVARYDAALDQFGPHSRIISPYQVQSDYNYVRGGDLDELRIYDRALGAADIATLATGASLPSLGELAPRTLSDPTTRAEWSFRYGWNRPDDLPPLLTAATTAVRKVEIHDAYDLKRWWWKGTDGIRETTWPGVYNQSRLPGRNDYFKLPDWDCYSLSGRAVTFTLPDEPWNHIEISGSAWGKAFLENSTGGEGSHAAPAAGPALFERVQGQEKTVHRLASSLRGASLKLRFENAEQEQPIGELAVYNVSDAAEPKGTSVLSYRLEPADPRVPASGAGIEELNTFVRGRHPADERSLILVARPEGVSVVSLPGAPAPGHASSPGVAGASSLVPSGRLAAQETSLPPGLPLLHIFIPASEEGAALSPDQVHGALDGIALELPAWKSNPRSRISFNVRVKDPLWPPRDLLDFTYSVQGGEAHTLWLDLRDRILPAGRGIYLTLAASETPAGLDEFAPSQVRLVFKSREAGRAEHELDRFTQARDSYAMLVEEHPHERRYRLWARFEDDLNDLLRVNPRHKLGLEYQADAMPKSPRVPFVQPAPARGEPLWAFRQIEVLRRARELVLWYIDHRQIPNGEMGGGLSDDTDLSNYWPGLVLMGEEPDKIADSNRRILEACYAHGMFTRGLPSIQTDELHTYEEGINALGQMLIVDWSSPRQLERAMETTRGLAGITGVNRAGHRHVRSSYYSGTRVATEGVWGWAKAFSYLVFQPVMQLADYNGDPAARQLIIEIADGLLAHRKLGADNRYVLPSAIEFATDNDGTASRGYSSWALFWNAWKWTGDRKYLAPILDDGAAALGSINPNALDQLDLRESWGRAIASGSDFEAKDFSRSGIVSQQNLHFAWQVTGDKKFLETLYANQIRQMDARRYINTEGSLWIDRVHISTSELQRARLGGVALSRNAVFPGHVVSWRFHAPATAESVAILIPRSTPAEFKVLVHNVENFAASATLTGWNVDPGLWEVSQGVDLDGDDTAEGTPDAPPRTQTLAFERSTSVDFSFPPRATTVLTFRNVKPGLPYHQRPDLGIDRGDLTLRKNELALTVHNLGSVPSPETRLALIDSSGASVTTIRIPALPAPAGLEPSTLRLSLPLPDGFDPSRGRVVIDPDRALQEITRLNNEVQLSAVAAVVAATTTAVAPAEAPPVRAPSE